MLLKAYFSFSQSYLIKKGWYLIPTPPQKPTLAALSGLRAFEKLKQKNKDNPNFFTQPEIIQKQKIMSEVKKYIQQYHKKFNEYQAKYIKPTKKYNYFSLEVARWFEANKDNKQRNLEQAIQSVRSKIYLFNQEQMTKLKKEAEQINKKNSQSIKQLKLAVDQYQNLENFMLKTKKVNVKAIAKENLGKYEAQYTKYKTQQNHKLKEQAKKFHIKEEELKQIIKEHWKEIEQQQKRRSKTQDQQDQQDQDD